MWQYWLLGFLGLWIILMPFLGFPFGLQRTLTIITGVLITVLGFWAAGKAGNREEV